MLFEPLFAHADAQPQTIAIHDDRGSYTYQQLAAMAAGLGMYLSFQTDKPRVGLLVPASAGFVASFFGTLLAGKSVVPINYLLGDREIAHIIADSGIDTVVTIPLLAARLKDHPIKIVDLLALPSAPPAAITPRFPQVNRDDMAVLLYTSGTSGLPKGVVLTYGNFQSDMDAAIEHANLQKRHMFLGIIPLFHSFGITATMLAPIQLGATVAYLARFSGPGTLAGNHAAGNAHRSAIGQIVELRGGTNALLSQFVAMVSHGVRSNGHSGSAKICDEPFLGSHGQQG